MGSLTVSSTHSRPVPRTRHLCEDRSTPEFPAQKFWMNLWKMRIHMFHLKSALLPNCDTDEGLKHCFPKTTNPLNSSGSEVIWNPLGPTKQLTLFVNFSRHWELEKKWSDWTVSIEACGTSDSLSWTSRLQTQAQIIYSLGFSAHLNSIPDNLRSDLSIDKMRIVTLN